MYELDCKKIEYLIENVREREKATTELHKRRTTEVDELFEKKKQMELERAQVEEELADLKRQNLALPAQFKQLEDHFVRTEQEKRRLDIEKKKLDQKQAELEKKRRGSNPSNPRMKGNGEAASRLGNRNSKGIKASKSE